MRFYWFGRTHMSDFKGLIDKLEDAGFYGTLLPYVVGMPDQFIKIANTISKNQKIKYIVAIRPYTISPQYLTAMCKSMDHIQPDRVMINFVAGQVDSYELAFGGIIGDITDQTPPLERKKYLLEYVKTFWNLNFASIKAKRPKVFISGMSQEIFDIVEEYADYNIVAYEAYKRHGGFKEISKPRVVSICPVIFNTEEDILDFDIKDAPQDMIPVTREGLVQIIKDLEKDGINDIMFFSHGDELQRDRIIEFVRDYNFKS